MSKKRAKLPVKKKLVFGLVFALLLVVGLEGGLRALGFPRGLVRNFSKLWNPAAEQLPGLFRPGKHRVSYPTELAYDVEINALGLRGPALAPAKAKDARRILCLGDSVTFGYYVNDPETYPAQLQGLLAAENPGLEVINGGCGHFSIPDEARYFREGLKALQPDVVVLQFCSNDVLPAELDRSPTLYEEIRSGEAASGNWLRQTAIGEVQLMAAIHFKEWQKRRAGKWPPEDFGAPEVVPADTWERYVTQFKAFRAELAAAKIPLVVTCFVDLADATRKSSLHDARLKELCSDEDVPYAELLSRYGAVKEPKTLYHYPLDPHPSPLGNKLMAEAVAAALRDEGLAE